MATFEIQGMGEADPFLIDQFVISLPPLSGSALPEKVEETLSKKKSTHCLYSLKKAAVLQKPETFFF